MAKETKQILSFEELLTEARKTYIDIYEGDMGIEEFEQLAVIGDFIEFAGQQIQSQGTLN